MRNLYGNTQGLKPNQLRRIEKLYQRRIPPHQIVTPEFARQLSELSHETNRQIGALIDELREMSLPNGTSQPIINQLSAAYEQTADGSPACKKVSDFLSMVQKKSSNIPPETVEYVTGEANRILSVMGCVAPAREIVAVTGSFQRSR